ncbi:MAG: HigA family addiction module antitoxin [Patescibacteria group bacterium]
MSSSAKFVLFKPSTPIPPGETLNAVLKERGISQAELANRMQRPKKFINEIIHAKAAITPETALQLEVVLGVPSRFWNSLESSYRDILIREDEKNIKSKEVDAGKQFPYAEMLRLGWVPAANSMQERISFLQQYFGATSLTSVSLLEALPKGLYRIAKVNNYSIPAINAWARKGVIDGQKIQTQEFSKVKLIDSLNDIRALTTQNDLPKALKALRLILSDCGIAFVLTREISKAPINGITRWLTPSKALLQLSIRYKWEDVFWFSLFHEIGHILQHPKSEMQIELGTGPSLHPDYEVEADNFAKNTLIPPVDYASLVDHLKSGVKKDTIVSFANKINVSPAIVVGRLQHDHKIDFRIFNDLRRRIIWKN